MKFTEAKLEETFIQLLSQEGYPHFIGESLERSVEEVLLEEDLLDYLLTQVSHPLFIGFKTIISSMKTKGNPWFYCIFKLLDKKYKTCYNTKILLKFKS